MQWKPEFFVGVAGLFWRKESLFRAASSPSPEKKVGPGMRGDWTKGKKGKDISLISEHSPIWSDIHAYAYASKPIGTLTKSR